MLTDAPKYARVSAIAREFGVSASTLRRLADRGEVRAVRIGSHRFFERASVKRYMDGEAPARHEGESTIYELQAFRARNERFRARLREDRG